MNMIDTLAVAVSSQDHVRGLETAPVTLLVYGDFACRYCAQAYPVVRELLLKYRTTLRFVFRHNPRGELHEGARLAAHGAEAAAAQGQFWQMHDMLFERREPISEQRLVGYAILLNLDLSRFRADLHSPEIASRVREDEIGGLHSGVVGTPTFFINGRHFRDKPDLETLSMAIAFRLLSSSHEKRRAARRPNYSEEG
jgi:protein-disulfide isomerase